MNIAHLRIYEYMLMRINYFGFGLRIRGKSGNFEKTEK